MNDAARAHEALVGLAGALRSGRSVLLALDFDGTLAPLVDDPAQSRALPQAADALDRLSRVHGLRLAVVSGRALDDLTRLAPLPEGTLLVGSHGAERGHMTDGQVIRDELTLDGEAADRLERVERAMTDAVAGSSARLEHKPASVVLHTRRADADDAARLTEVALTLAEPGVDVMHGKDVVELSVLDITKGHALADLRAELAVDVLVYAGDDVTDERAFATLGEDDLTIRVGPGDTAARHRVPDPEALAAALADLADACDQAHLERERQA